MTRSKHPYQKRPTYTQWKNAVSQVEYKELDLVVAPRFSVDSDTRVSTAGSCFAQHISRNLKTNGFKFFVTEQANPVIPDKYHADYNYGVFSARYGNLYTSRQLLQLFKRAYGQSVPVDDIWEAGDGAYIDPYRPTIQPNGFASREEFYADREQHYAAVRAIAEQSDIFVFTLGLTECWVNIEDGSVYPLCPGTAGGEFSEAAHKYVNLSHDDIVGDFDAFLALIRERNPKVRVLLTVSPVPLIATMEDRHVVVSSTCSKSILRVVCDTLRRKYDYVDYFPSYEIVMSPFNDVAYFAEDKRSVNGAGVAHAMKMFLRNYCNRESVPFVEGEVRRKVSEDEIDQNFRVICDEELLDAFS